MITSPQLSFLNENAARIVGERQSQRLLTAFLASGMFFMLLPGTFLGVWSLLDISQAHLPSALPQTWLQAHGQAQIFGWIGSFIIGIGFYSLTRMQSTMAFPARAGWAVWSLWTSGVLLRWIAGVTGHDWRAAMPLSAVMQLAGYLLLYLSVRKLRSKTPRKSGTWMHLVAAATVGFLIALVANCWILFWQAFRGDSPALPHVLDQQFMLLVLWGVLIPTIWGFNARWLPVFAGLKQPNGRNVLVAYALSVTGIVAAFLDLLSVSAVAFFLAAVLAIDALHVWKTAVHPPKLLNVHRSFALFVRLTYAWLLVSCILSLLAVPFDHAGGIWGASRHAVTVGFVAGMVFVIGQRVLPAFCGMRVLWSKRLMFWSLLLLYCGCFLRVCSEPLAYENLWTFAWKVLPVSAILEIIAISLFALNLVATLVQPPAHLRREAQPSVQSAGAA